MTSHVRHRRTSNPATAFPTPIEPGEIAVNTANRQAAVGDAATGSLGVPLPLIAVRYFDTRAQYAADDFVVQAGAFYRAKVSVAPGAFNLAQWDLYSPEAVAKAYADVGDAAVTAAFVAADAGLQTDIDGKLPLTGGTLSGPLYLPVGAPVNDNQAATKKYVDDAVTEVVVGSIDASDVVITPVGAIEATDVQAAIAELDTEKAPLYSPDFTGTPTAPTPAVDDNSEQIATTAFVAGQAGFSMPAMDGAQAVGVSLKYARDDHRHPTDTSRAPIDSPAFTGTPTAPTPPVGTNTNQIATTAFVMNAPATVVADGSITFSKMAATALATVNEFLANVANKLLVVDKVWAAAVPVTLVDASAVTPNLSNGIDFIWSPAVPGRALNNPTNTKPGQKGIIYIVQPPAGSATIATWGTAYKFPGGAKPVLSTAGNAVDVLSYAVKSATEIECFFSRGMA